MYVDCRSDTETIIAQIAERCAVKSRLISKVLSGLNQSVLIDGSGLN